MNISARIAKLERNLTGGHTVLDRFYAELDSVALRLTGRRWQTIATDRPLVNLVLDNLDLDFPRNLSGSDLATLTSAVEHIVFGDDTAARDKAKRAWLSSRESRSNEPSSAA